MIERDDLRAAVAAGTLSETQAANLLDLAARRHAGRAAIRPGEEPFELFRGFNEIFIVVGLGILASGWFGVWTLIAATSGRFASTWMIACCATLVVIAGLSEYFIRRRRMVAPSIALAVGWAVAAASFWILWNDAFTLLGAIDGRRAALPMALTTLTTAVFWWRYRVPFSMAIMAATAFVCLVMVLSNVGEPVSLQSLFLLSAGGPFALGTLLFGLIVFAVAMWFDMGDPHRVSLRSANGFWLHVIAAPAIVNTLALTLIDGGGALALGVLGVFLWAIALVAIAIDRRSFLISAVGYIVALVFTLTDGDGFAPVVLLLGVALVALGAGWQRVRSAILPIVPQAVRDRLPPVA